MAITRKYELDESAIKEAIAYYLENNAAATVKPKDVELHTRKVYGYGDAVMGHSVTAEATGRTTT
jgi:hypothetical protein